MSNQNQTRALHPEERHALETKLASARAVATDSYLRDSVRDAARKEASEIEAELSPIAGHTPLPTWRVVHDPEEIHQYCGFMAVLAGCGPSRAFPGKFWWNVGATPVSQRVETKYVDTLSEARALIEKHLEPYIARMNPEPRVEAEPAVPSLPALLAEGEGKDWQINHLRKENEKLQLSYQEICNHEECDHYICIECRKDTHPGADCHAVPEPAFAQVASLTKERDELKAELREVKHAACAFEDRMNAVCASNGELKAEVERLRSAAQLSAGDGKWTQESFRQHVGSKSFSEAIEVTLRATSQREAQIEEMYGRIKELGAKLRESNQKFSDAEQWNKLTSVELETLRSLYNETDADLSAARALLKQMEKLASYVERMNDSADLYESAAGKEHTCMGPFKTKPCPHCAPIIEARPPFDEYREDKELKAALAAYREEQK